MFKKLPKLNSHPTRNVSSSKDNNTGYTLNVTILKNGAKVFESGMSTFHYSESLSSFYTIDSSLNLSHNEFLLLCADFIKKGHHVDLENFPTFFYCLQIHAEFRDSKHKTIKEFNGIISNASAHIYGQANERMIRISFTAHPVAWFMQETNHYQAFINKPADKIIEEVVQKFCNETKIGVNFKPKFILRKEKDLTRINCVQNGESDWDFILRLIDEEDWNFVFVQDKNKAEMHIYDNNDSPTKLIPKGINPFLKLEIIDSLENISQGTNDQLLMKKEYISNIEYVKTNISTATEVTDSDYRAHGKTLKAKHKTPSTGKIKKAVQFRWHLHNEGSKKYVSVGDSSKNPKVRAKKYEEKFSKNIYLLNAITNSVKVHLGSIITAVYPMQTNSFKTILNNKITNFRVQEVNFAFHNTTSATGSFSEFHTSLVMNPRDSRFNIEHTYERNYIDGTTHAKVVADDKKIYLDKDFFIKISLPWQYNEKNNFIYARYMSPWASQKYGMFVTPRHDDEVIVTFEDGDPDLPLVIGSVYNPKKNYPVDFKTKKHVLTIYDQPSENKKNNFFEMDHKKASVNLAAAQHMKIRSFGDHLTQSKWKMEMITAKNMLSKSKEQMEFKAEKNMLHEAKEHMEVLTEKYYNLQAKEHVEFHTDKYFMVEAKDHVDIKADKHMTITSKEDMMTSTDKMFKLTSKEDMTISTDKKFTLNAKEDLVIKSDKTITIEVGQSKIILDKSGTISIVGKQIKLQGATDALSIK